MQINAKFEEYIWFPSSMFYALLHWKHSFIFAGSRKWERRGEKLSVKKTIAMDGKYYINPTKILALGNIYYIHKKYVYVLIYINIWIIILHIKHF